MRERALSTGACATYARRFVGRRRRGGRPRRSPGGPPLPTTPARQLASGRERRRKLLGLFYDDRIGADLYAEEERRLTQLIEAARAATEETERSTAAMDDLAARFDELADVLLQLNVERVWEEADETERRVLLHELVHHVEVHRDHLEVSIHGAPKLNVALEEVGPNGPPVEICRVGGALDPLRTRIDLA